MSTTEAKNLARQYAEYLRKKRFPYDQIYLFGSFAKGNQHKWSDIDIAVISKKFDEEDVNKWFENRLRLWKYRRDIDSRIEPHGLSPDEFDSDDSIMAYEIKKTGIKIE